MTLLSKIINSRPQIGPLHKPDAPDLCVPIYQTSHNYSKAYCRPHTYTPQDPNEPVDHASVNEADVPTKGEPRDEAAPLPSSGKAETTLGLLLSCACSAMPKGYVFVRRGCRILRER